MEASLVLDPGSAPEPDHLAEPDGFVVLVEPSDRLHFLDWSGPSDRAAAAGAADGTHARPGPRGDAGAPGVLLIHGVAQTAWVWTPVARRLIARRKTVAMDLRGHGLSDAPTSGYDPATLVEDALAVADGSGALREGGLVLAGHGFGAALAAWTAAALGDRAAGLVLVDGGWEDLRADTGQEPDEFLRSVEEPPEVLRSMRAFLRDRAAFDPTTWDADQEHAARATVVATPAGRVVPATRPHALAGIVNAMFDYRPGDVLSTIAAPIVALVAADEAGSRVAALADVQARRRDAGRAPIPVATFADAGHNLMRYRPAEVTAAILSVSAAATDGRTPQARG